MIHAPFITRAKLIWPTTSIQSVTNRYARALAILNTRRFALTIAVSGAALVVAMSWLINHPTPWTFTSHYNYGFSDLHGRLVNLHQLEQTGNIYVPFGQFAFTYPPGAILFFWPILWAPAQHLTLLWSAASLVALAGALAAAITYLFPRRLAPLAVTGISCWTAVLAAAFIVPVTECFTWGQTGTILLCFVILDLLTIHGPPKGVLVGVATAVKIYPGLFIVVWLLRREWRAAFTALATASSLTGLAWLLWPPSVSTFFSQVFLGGKDYARLAGGADALVSSSLTAFFQRAPFHIGLLSPKESLALSAAVAVIALIAAQRMWRQNYELSALVVVLIASVICTPVTWDHYFAFAPLFFLMPFELGLKSPLASTAIVTGLVMMVPWFFFRQPLDHTWWTATYAFVARGALLFATLAVIVATFFQKPSDRPLPRMARLDESSLSRN